MANKVGYHSIVIDATGIGTLATITVYDAGTLNLSTIYSTPGGAAQVNPFATDANGRFVFYATPSEYDIQASGAGFITYKLENVSIIGVFSQFVTSAPTSGEHRVKKLRLGATDNIVVTYDGTPEP
jgi:hypothetical protein